MKKKLLIGLGIFFSLVAVAISAVIIHFWPFIKAALPLISYSNIKAVYINMVMDEEQKEERLKDIDDKLSNDIQQYVSVEIRDFTEEELKLVESGEKTKTEIVAQIITEAAQQNKPSGDTSNNTTQVTPNNTTSNNTTQNQTQNNNTTKTETADEIVARHITKLYEYHSDFEQRVENLEASARNWLNLYYKANPSISWRDAKIATVEHFTETAKQIESDCYAKVDGQIALLEADLKAIGVTDLSVVTTVKEAAYNEMDVKKSKIVAEGQKHLS